MKLFDLFNIKINNKSILNVLFYIAIIFFAIVCISRLFNSSGLIMDSFEHIHASWLVGNGYIPYRDFFEHHNPLLWYLFSPLTLIFERKIVSIVYIARAISICGYLIVLFLFYKLAYRYTKDAISAKLSILFCISYPLIWYEIQNLRPDIFMYIFILCAIHFMFDYLENNKLKYLVFSYLSWVVSFLFLQKAVIYGLGFVLAIFFLLYEGKIHFKYIIQAAITPFLIAFLLFIFLYKTDLLSDWFYYNFTFNKLLIQYYKNGFYINVFLCLLALGIIRYYKQSEKGTILFCIWAMSFGAVLHFSPHSHYYFFYFLLTVLMLSPYFKTFFNRKPTLLFILLSFILIKSFYRLYDEKNSLSNHLNLMQYITTNSNKEDMLVNSHIPYNLFNNDAHFYWFGFHNVVIIGDLLTDVGFDYNNQIKNSKPKFVFINDNLFDKNAYYNTRWLYWRNSKLLRKASKGDLSYLNKRSDIDYDYWKIDMDFIKENYEHVKTYGNTQVWKRIDI